MLCSGEVVVINVAAVGEALVVLVKIIHGRLLYNRIEDPTEHVDRLIGDVAGGIDLSCIGFRIGKADERGDRGDMLERVDNGGRGGHSGDGRERAEHAWRAPRAKQLRGRHPRGRTGR